MNNIQKIALTVACLCLPMSGHCGYTSTSTKPTTATAAKPSAKPVLDVAGLSGGAVWMSKTKPAGGSMRYADASGNYYVYYNSRTKSATLVNATGKGQMKLDKFNPDGWTRTSNFTSL